MNNICVFSPCRKYRYSLFHIWDKDNPTYAMFIGLNPSTADENKLDPTLRRCAAFSKRWGYGGLVMTNIFAYRDTDPKIMKKQDDPIGPDNNSILLECSKEASVIIAAWGNHGEFMNRGNEVKKLIKNLCCLKLSKNGNPYHPLYLKGDLNPIPFAV